MKQTIRLALLTFVISLSATAVFAQTGPFSFFAITPCRAVDTRGGAPLGSGQTRNFAIRNVCGVPSTAAAVAINVTITGATTQSFLTVWPTGGARPNVSTINFTSTDQSLANGAIVGLGTTPTDLAVFNCCGNVHVLIDVTGYFQ
ncbi:MAG TPA: hypothetical protein VGA84_05345 [Thermoanaerobaculia bacterium]